MREAAEEQVARIPHARRREVRLDRRQGALRLRREPRPVSQRFRKLEVERDRVDAVMGRQPLREVSVKLCQPPRLVEAADGGGSRRARLVRLAEVVRVVDSPEATRAAARSTTLPPRNASDRTRLASSPPMRTSGAPGCREPRRCRPPRRGSSSGAPTSSMLARARSARAFASVPSPASSRALDAHSSMSSMFSRIDHIADRMDDWNARNAYASARSASSSGPSSARSSAFRIPSPSYRSACASPIARQRSACSCSSSESSTARVNSSTASSHLMTTPRELAGARQPVHRPRANTRELVGLVPPRRGPRPPPSPPRA